LTIAAPVSRGKNGKPLIIQVVNVKACIVDGEMDAARGVRERRGGSARNEQEKNKKRETKKNKKTDRHIDRVAETIEPHGKREESAAQEELNNKHAGAHRQSQR
jgi:hypothetical protein